MDAYKIFSWHPERFPDPKRLIDSLRAMNFHVVTIVDPGIKIEDGYASYEEGKKQGLFARYPGGDFYTGSVWPGRCHFPDFTSAKTRDWWGRSFSKLVDPGVEGFWNDMNEPAVWGQTIPDLVQFAFEGDTASMREAHNVYGMQMARATYEGTKKLLKRRPFVLTRAGYAGLQRYTAIWTGDNLASDGHMLLATRLVNSLGLSGIPFSGPDIGGFIGDPGHDLFSRWITIGTYTPLFRNHKCYGAKRQEPWSLGEDVETLCRQTIDERYRLLPYLYTAFSEATATGMPVARSLAIDWTFDRNVYDWKFQNEYLLGAHLLVAPVSSNEHIARVYLPPTPGGWYKMNSDERYTTAGPVPVDAPIYDLPVFVRAGAVLPLQRAVQHTAEKVDTLELHVYAGPAETQSLYYEDDGSSDAYREGSFHRRVLRATPGSVLLERATGTFAPRHSAIRFVFHGFETEPSLTINDAPVACTPVPGWTQPRFEAHAPYSSDAMVLRYKAYR
jgi:alpha-glucosidase